MFTMRFLGGDRRAPLLRETITENPWAIAKQAVALVEKLLDAFIVHGDLSEFNLLLHQRKLHAIDFPQAVDLSSRVDRVSKFEEAKPLLYRDLKNIENYFRRYGVILNADKEYKALSDRFETLCC